MNVIGEKFKDKKKWGNRQKLFLFVVGGCETFSKFWNSQQHECRKCN